MVFVFFVYGLAFFVLGFVVLMYPKKGSAFKVAGDLWLIAAFGISHGINEWLDMVILVHKPAEMSLSVARMVTLPLSCSHFARIWSNNSSCAGVKTKGARGITGC